MRRPLFIIFAVTLAAITAQAQHDHGIAPAGIPVTEDWRAAEQVMFSTCDRPEELQARYRGAVAHADFKLPKRTGPRQVDDTDLVNALEFRDAFRHRAVIAPFVVEIRDHFCAPYMALIDAYNAPILAQANLPLNQQTPTPAEVQVDFLLRKRALVEQELSAIINTDEKMGGDFLAFIRDEGKNHMNFAPEVDHNGAPVVMPAKLVMKERAKLVRAGLIGGRLLNAQSVGGSNYSEGFTTYWSTAASSYSTNGDGDLQTAPQDSGPWSWEYQNMQIVGTYSAAQCQYVYQGPSLGWQWEPSGCPAYHQPTLNNWLTLTDKTLTQDYGDYGGGWFVGGQWRFDAYMNYSTTASWAWSPGQIWSNIQIYSRVFCDLAKAFIVYWTSNHAGWTYAQAKTIWTGTGSISGGSNICNLQNNCQYRYQGGPPWALNMQAVNQQYTTCKPAYNCVALCEVQEDAAGRWITACPGGLTGAPTGKYITTPADTNWKVACWAYRSLLPLGSGLIDTSPGRDCTAYYIP
jgi:hypothetical protein